MKFNTQFFIFLGIPLLEGCVASSVKVVEALCLEENAVFNLPWECEKEISEKKFV